MYTGSYLLHSPVLMSTYELVYRSMCALGLWAEVEMDRRVTEHGGDINDFLDMVLGNSSQQISVRRSCMNVHIFAL